MYTRGQIKKRGAESREGHLIKEGEGEGMMKEA
jgi:hypothetical protein